MALKKKLGITKDVVAESGIPINAPRKMEKRTAQYPNGYEFPITQLVNVVCTPEKEIKRQDGTIDKLPTLSFVFRTADAKQFTHVEFPLDDDDDKFDSRMEAMNQRIKHIFNHTIGEKHFKDDSMTGDDFLEFFTNVANAFNNETITIQSKVEGEKDKVVRLYTKARVYLKLTYYKTRLQLPQYPNFVQRVVENQECNLVINPQYDQVEAIASANKGINAGYTGGTNNNFGADASDGFEDFPDVN